MMATIEDLPKELLLEIFSHYIRSEGHEAFSKNIPRVCKDWNELSSDSSLWRDVISYDWNYLLNVSRRGLLYNTQSLECDRYDKSYSDMKLTAVLKNIRDLKALVVEGFMLSGTAIKFITKHCPHLERLCLKIGSYGLWDQLLTVCGPTLKNLELDYHGPYEVEQQHLLSGIAAKCPLLESLVFFLGVDGAPFPIHELRSGCPRLRELELHRCHLITDGENDSMDCGLKDLKKFSAFNCDFSGLAVQHLLKDSIDLEQLELYDNKNLIFGNILKIPSDKVRILNIYLTDPDDNLEALEDAVWRWRRTLSVLELRGWRNDVSYALERLLQDNPNPQLETLIISDYIKECFIEEFVLK